MIQESKFSFKNFFNSILNTNAFQPCKAAKIAISQLCLVS